MELKDTIAALSTATGPAALAMVRLSGPLAAQVADRIFQGKYSPTAMTSHTLHLGSIVDRQGAPVDEVLLAVLRAPHSFTAEDMVEITCHGGPVVAVAVLEAAVGAGARPAGPGEFSLRAYLNGRIDLCQAESVCDLINSKTKAAAKAALERLSGGLSRRLADVRSRLLDAAALLEVDIDFPEEDLPQNDGARLAELLEGAVVDLGQLVESGQAASVLQDGATVVIAGKPNVGKSSLFNMLLREERAIVAAQPGTTRDVIESWIEIRGIPVRLFDTAGLRDADGVEGHGVDRARSKLEQAGLVLLVVDGSQPLTGEDRQLLDDCEPGRRLVLANKADLPQALAPEPQWLQVSAITEQGLHQLEEAIAKHLLGPDGSRPEMTANLRQVEALTQAQAAAVSASQVLKAGQPLELAAADLRDAINRLGTVSGEALRQGSGQAIDDEVLKRIFSRFCIGK